MPAPRKDYEIIRRLEAVKATSRLTWAEVGMELGIEESTVGAVVAGHRRLGKLALERLAEIEKGTTRLERIEKMVAEGFAAIHARLDELAGEARPKRAVEPKVERLG